MNICIIISLFIVLIVVIAFFMIKRKYNYHFNKEQNTKKINLSVDNHESLFPDIQIIENTDLIPLEKNKIIDSNIKNAISILDNSVAKTTMIGKNLNNANKILNSDRAFFSAAKSGTENMMKVKGSNELYGTQMVNGKFSKNTKFLKEDKLMTNIGKDALVNAGVNAASMVVGQYYMNEINNKLENIQRDINEITNFLDNQYQSKIMYIISKVQEILENKNEIINNDFSRDKRYNEISRAEENCAELLTQANLSIIKYLKDDLDYKNYEKSIKDIQAWFERQQILTKLLVGIGDLRYVLSNGNETSKSAHSQYNKYLIHNNEVNEQLARWHRLYCKKFDINQRKHRRKAKFFELRKNTIGKINEDWAYNKLDKSIEIMIENQMNVKVLEPYIKDKQDENIKILKYNGEYYNLPNTSYK